MSSTLLQKAQQALNEKITKVLPENIKSGVTMFGITGSYTGEGGSAATTFDPNSKLIIDFPALATFMNANLIAEEKAKPIIRDGSGFTVGVQLSMLFDMTSGSDSDCSAFGIGVGSDPELFLVFDPYNSKQFYTANTATEDYFATGMTVQDLITVFSKMEVMTIAIPYEYVVGKILYGISAIKIYFDETKGDAVSILNLPEGICTIQSEGYNEHIHAGDDLVVDWGEVANIIRGYCTAEELAKPINAFASGYHPAILLNEGGEFTDGSQDYSDINLYVAMPTDEWLGVNIGNDDESDIHLTSRAITTPATDEEFPNPCTVADLCNILDNVGVVHHRCFMGADETENVYSFYQPITSLKVLGPTLEKVIDFTDSQYTNPVSVFHSGN